VAVLVQELRRLATIIIEDSRETTYLFLQLYLQWLCRRGTNAVSFQNTIIHSRL